MKKILFFANVPTRDANSIGGATVLANNILLYISKENKFEVTHQQIRSNWNKYGQILDYFIWMFKAPFVFRKYNIISFHATNDFNLTIAPIIWLWAKILDKKIIYHFFGGIFYEKYERSFFLHKLIMKKTILSSNTVFMETKMMINSFRHEKLNNLVWLPNTRKENLFSPHKVFNKRFVFISRVTPSKGILELVLASKSLSEDYKIDIYGPLDKEHYDNKFFKEKDKLEYKGLIDPQEVITTLRKYDVLILPTYYSGEGYPGIIIESLSIGIPVITTNWRALPEIINNKNGILVEPKNYIELTKAILHFSDDNYSDYSKEAINSFKQFSINFVFSKLLIAYNE
jgi:glycosyltransferase involved in cell wall biosynthesis